MGDADAVDVAGFALEGFVTDSSTMAEASVVSMAAGGAAASSIFSVVSSEIALGTDGGEDSDDEAADDDASKGLEVVVVVIADVASDGESSEEALSPEFEAVAIAAGISKFPRDESTAESAEDSGRSEAEREEATFSEPSSEAMAPSVVAAVAIVNRQDVHLRRTASVTDS